MRRPLLALGAAVAAREVLRRTLNPGLDLRARVVAITGGSRGLGYALAREMGVQHGARIAICARTPEPLEQARQHLEQAGVEVLALRCDVADREQAESFIRQVTQRFGQIDVLVNNAGIIMVGPLENQTLRDFEDAMAVMYWGMVYPTLAVLPQMRARAEGRIVNITSIGGKVSIPHLASYSAAKFAAVGFSEGLRAETAAHGIKVTTVVPGLMRTGSQINAFFKGQHRVEYTLFSLLGNLPFTSVAANDAARMIVNALRRGDPEVILGWQAGLLARLNGVFPGLMAETLAVVNRFLPGPGSNARHAGRDSETSLSRSPLTALGQKAEREFNQR